MATVDSINTARSIASVIPHVQSAADTSPWMVAQHVPALGTGGSSAFIAHVLGGDITCTVDGAAPAGADAIGASGVIDTSSPSLNTMGEVVDVFNGARAWRAYLVGALRADLASGMLAKTRASAYGDNGLTFYGDTSENRAAVIPGTEGAHEQVSVAISGEKFVNNGINGHVKDWEDKCENSMTYGEFLLTFTGNTTDTVPKGLRVFSAKAGDTEVLLFNKALTSAVELDLGRTGTAQVDGVDDIFIKAPIGHRLIVRASTSTAFSAFTKFNVHGKTAVLSGNHIVTEVNY